MVRKFLKKAHNISTMTVAGEEADVSPQTVESWRERSRELIKGWQPENVWNMDETGCFWKGLPDVSLNEMGKKMQWRKAVQTKKNLRRHG